MDEFVRQFETNFREHGHRQALARRGCWHGAWEAVRGDRPLVAVVPGAFRPPHRGHMDMVARLARCCAGVVVVIRPDEEAGRVGGGRRIPAELAMDVWRQCLPYVLPEELESRVLVAQGAASEICAALAPACEVVLVAGQEAMAVNPRDHAFPCLLLPREAPVSSTSMATVPLWSGAGEDDHASYIMDFLPPSLPLALAERLSRTIALQLARARPR